MSDEIMLTFGEDGVAREYDDMWGIIIRCESQEEQDEVWAKLKKKEWIPCSKTVDIPDHEVLVCDRRGEMMFGYLACEDEQWICDSDGCVMYDPIAWREKPEPYKYGDSDA